jgi:hypothetical protein
MEDGMSEQIPVEAIEAAALVLNERTSLTWEDNFEKAERALVAALPYLAAHDAEVARVPEGTRPGCTGADDCRAPAHVHGCYADTEGHCDAPEDHAEAARAVRVLPSAEDVARALAEAYDDGSFTEGVDDPERWDADAEDRDHWRKGATAVLALFADAPSREQVEREVAEKALREAADDYYRMEPGTVGASDVEVFVSVAEVKRWLRARADRLAAGGEAL